MDLVRFLRHGESGWAPPPVGLPRIGACLTWIDGIEPWRFAEELLSRIPAVAPFSIFLDRQDRLLLGYREREIGREPFGDTVARARKANDTGFPERIELRCADRLVCSVESEFWHRVGGPSPYHDSVTLSFYSRELTPELVAVTAHAAAEACGARFEGEVPPGR